MPVQVSSGAALACTFGLSPGTLMVPPPPARAVAATTPAANVNDFVPLTNISTFGMCASLANPTVASATAAASGVLTPQPCIPNTSAPWSPGSLKTLINGQPGLTNSCTCQCLWGGTLTVTAPGQVKVNTL